MTLSTAPAPIPSRITMEGRYAVIEPIDPRRHGNDLWNASNGPENHGLWTYLAEGPFQSREEFDALLRAKASSEDPLVFAIIDRANGRAKGYASYMRIEPKHRVIEVGGILFTHSLQRTRAATEAMYLMARHVFEELGYRRYEWKCNALNEPSRRAALRLGFTFEGIFRRHMIVKGQNRDTAWFSMLDSEWPQRKQALERWLARENFDENGRQKSPLSSTR